MIEPDHVEMKGAADDPRTAAALNNAEWCAAIWRSHGLPVERAHGMLFTRSGVPPFYPNAVTVDPVTDPAIQADFIADLAGDRTAFGVKDSFTRLPLDRRGFRRLFRATWLRSERIAPCEAAPASLHWTRLLAESNLEAWELAWQGGEASCRGIFKPVLLADERAIILAGIDRFGVIKAGGCAYDAAGVLGVTNIFGKAECFLDALFSHSSRKPVVRYEHGQALESARRLGFESLGPLRVWSRPD